MFSCLIHYFKKEMDVFCACVCITLWVLCDIQETQWAENKAFAVPCSLITDSFLLWFPTQLVTYWKLCALLRLCACQCISCIFPYYSKQNCLILFKQHYMDCNIIYLISSWLMSIDVALNKPPVEKCCQEYPACRCFFLHASAFWAINTGEFCWLVCLGLWWLWPTPRKVQKKREWTEKQTYRKTRDVLNQRMCLWPEGKNSPVPWAEDQTGAVCGDPDLWSLAEPGDQQYLLYTCWKPGPGSVFNPDPSPWPFESVTTMQNG